MRPPNRCARIRLLERAQAVLIALLFTLPLRAQKGAGLILLLDVQINGQAIGRIGEFTQRKGVLLARSSELQELGIAVPVMPRSKPDDLVDLSALPDLAWRLDTSTQTLYLTAAENRLTTKLFQASDHGKERQVIEAGKGVLLNYDILNTLAADGSGVDGSFTLRGFSGDGNLQSGLLAYAGTNAGNINRRGLVRLDSTYTLADAASMRLYSVGDFVTGNLIWTRPIHVAGLQVRSDFATRPDLVTFPLPAVSGSTAVPSTVSILANNTLITTQQTDVGPFQVSQLPVVTGAGTLSMVVTNALGQQVTLNQPFYATSALLAPGLKNFSVQTGAVRRNWGASSNDYGKLAASSTYRYGLTPRLTVEGSAEGTAGVLMAGAGVVVNVFDQGVVNVALAASSSTGSAGGQISAAFERVGRTFSVTGSAILASPGFRDVAAVNGDPVPTKQLNGTLGFNSRHLGSFGIAYAGVDSSMGMADFDPAPAQRSHIVSASYSVQLRRLSFLASTLRSLTNSGSDGVSFGVTIPLGNRSSVALSTASSSGGGGQLQLQQSAVYVGDWGYQAYISAGEAAHNFAQVLYRSRDGLLSAGIDHSSRGTSTVFEGQGALSLIDGGLFPSNTVNDSFAIVDTGGLSHIHVLEENIDIGKTDTHGRLLVPDLRSFDLNQIAIEPTDLPLDAVINSTVRKVRPQDHTGIIVRFPITTGRAALVKLVDATGQPLPIGSTATLLATGIAVPVGYDGESYLTNLSPHNQLRVELPDGRCCTLSVEYRPTPGEITTIGPLTCPAS